MLDLIIAAATRPPPPVRGVVYALLVLALLWAGTRDVFSQ
jgi:hypothetical protein